MSDPTTSATRRSVRARSRRERMLLRAAVSLGALGVGTLAVGLVLAFTGVGSGASTEAAAGEPTGHVADAAPEASGSADADVQVVGSGSITALVQPAWAKQIAQQTGIPERAMRAYAGATISVARDQPGCGLAWNTLAAIGEVESDHGRIGGSVLDDTGRATPGIVGIALDGDGVADIADTDGGALDGDSEHDRAVGPMQMIPQTWAVYAVDGSGDGVADPQNIDDAALAAAHYLCATGYDLSTSSGWIAAIDAYNQGVDYNNAVAAVANRFAAAA